MNPGEAYRTGTVGKPLPGTEVRIADDGEILLRGPGIMEGYHGLPEKTAEVLESDGWFHTGDIGELSPDGYLRITDRKKDLIKTSGGKYIAPAEVEGQFKAVCPYVSNILVHGADRNFCTALISLDEPSILGWAADNGLSGKSYAEVVAAPATVELIDGYVKTLNEGLQRWQTIKKFKLLPRDLDIEHGELTPEPEAEAPGRGAGVQAPDRRDVRRVARGVAPRLGACPRRRLRSRRAGRVQPPRRCRGAGRGHRPRPFRISREQVLHVAYVVAQFEYVLEVAGRHVGLYRAQAVGEFVELRLLAGEHPLQLPVLAVQIEEDGHLGAQHPGVERLGEIVGGSGRVPAERVARVGVRAGQEDDRYVLGLVEPLDVRGRLETVHARHPDVEQDDGEPLPQQRLHRLLARTGAYERFVEGPQDGLQRDQVVLHVVHEEDAGALVGRCLSAHGD